MQLLHIAYVFVALACNYEAVPLSSNLQQSMDVVFGKNNIPNNSKFGKLGRDISSAKRYMMGLYQYMNSTECSMGQCFNKSVIASTDSENMVHDADTIVSFVHHRKYCIFNLNLYCLVGYMLLFIFQYLLRAIFINSE